MRCAFACLIMGLALSGCGNFSIPQDKVAAELETYGKQHPEGHIRIKTRLGTIVCELYGDTPLHRANLLRLIAKGFYTDEAEFYRVKENFMAQAGERSRQEPDFLVPAEISARHFHRRGALAAARRENNPGQASNPADFYIVTGEGWDAGTLAVLGIKPSDPRFNIYVREGGYPYLDGKYTVFGQVTEGMEVVDKITQLRTREERPLEPVLFEIETF